MNETHIARVAAELGLSSGQVRATARLLSEGATVPFICRYRKEATGSLDEVAVAKVRDRLAELAELDARREAILSSLAERELLAPELKSGIMAAPSLAVLEDLYLPFRPKRRTRAMIAAEKGLAPLADLLMAQGRQDPGEAARPFVSADKGVADVSEALAGARDIIAERVSEDAAARAAMRRLFAERGMLRSRVAKGKESEGAKFRDYFDTEEKARTMAGHRVLAVLRGEREGMLSVAVRPPEEQALGMLKQRFVKGGGPASAQVAAAVEDGYKRLLAPSMENEMRAELKKRADDEAIKVFAANLRELLLAPPLGGKRILALDPGFRTGAKLVCLDAQGKLVHHETIFPTGSERQTREAGERVRALCKDFGVEAVAVGNGTAGRETEAFVRSLGLPREVGVVMVNESGASVYSASEAAREEFPDLDATVRGGVSIGRRLMDPLAELVKIDPKAIGVGQYQHDVDQTALNRALDDVVTSCVNGVGVEVNTASAALLSYVSGLGPSLARNIKDHRDEHGPFSSRRDLLKVKRLGPKAFEQAAGFLRIRDAGNPLDRTGVHPERYPLVERMARDQGCPVARLMEDESLRRAIDLTRYASDEVGLPTLSDILAELARPGRDPRSEFQAFAFAEGVHDLNDLSPGMLLPGIVTNVTRFGAFVDVGVHQDGLVHVSQLADRFVKDPAEVVHVGQQVRVRVLEVDMQRRRISLSLRLTQTEKKNASGGQGG